MNPNSIQNDIAGGILIIWLALAYVFFIARRGLPSDKAPGRKTPRMAIVDRAIFFLAFFVLPVLGFEVFGFELPGRAVLSTGHPGKWGLPVLGLSAAVFCLGNFARKGDAEIANYPQYLPLRWGFRTLVIEVLSWSMYLFAYEFAFRGMILYALVPSGYWIAIAVQTALYAFAHLPKSSREAGGAIVFGVLTAAMTLAWGSLLPAFFVHLALALGNDMGCDRARRSRAG